MLFLAGLNAAVNRDVAYSVRMEAGVQSPDETLRLGIGSCRDSAWLLVSLLRQYGLAARFVSGYLVQLAADPDSMVGLDGPTGPVADFTDLHAWAEVFVPGAGWIGLDPTSALFAGEGHIPLSATPHPSAAAPIEGVTGPVDVTFSFHNEVRRIHEDPRVTRPYTDDQWARIDALGEAVDERLRAGDVRLTMGGEPTFVSRDDATTAQWNTDADGPEKRAAGQRPRRPGCRRRTPSAASCTAARASGTRASRCRAGTSPCSGAPTAQPLWQDPTLFADPWDGRSPTPTRRAAPRRSPGGSPRPSACPPTSCSRPTRTRSRRSPPTCAARTASRSRATPTRSTDTRWPCSTARSRRSAGCCRS